MSDSVRWRSKVLIVSQIKDILALAIRSRYLELLAHVLRSFIIYSQTHRGNLYNGLEINIYIRAERTKRDSRNPRTSSLSCLNYNVQNPGHPGVIWISVAGQSVYVLVFRTNSLWSIIENQAFNRLCKRNT